jgi:hypothetical protein
MAEILKETIAGVMQRLEKKQGRGQEENPQQFLGKIFTKRELGHVALNYFHKGILAVRVDSSAWLYALSLKKEEKMRKLRAKTKVVIKDMRFSLGESK